MTDWDAEAREVLTQALNEWQHDPLLRDVYVLLVPRIAALARRAEREGLERAVEIVSTFVARDIAAFNAGRADNPLWTTALAEACGPVLRQLAARLRREIEGAGR